MVSTPAIVPAQSNAGLQINFRSNVEDVAQGFRDTDRWAVPYITAGALNDTVFHARKVEQRAMPHYLDRPVAYTQRGVLYDKATAKHLVARVYINDDPTGGTPQAKYLEPNIVGGFRGPKPYERRLRRAGILRADEFTVPGAGMRLNVHGNIPGGRIERMLSQLQAAEQFAGYQANETRRSRRRNVRTGKERYFVAQGDTALPRGIWERRGKRIRPMLLFVSGAPAYSPIYPFGRAAIEHAEFNFARYWVRRFDRMLKSGRIFKGAGQLSRGGS